MDNSTLMSYTYTLNDSASTPVEEDSLFRISLTAVNSVTRSIPSQYVETTTAEAGILRSNCYSCCGEINLIHCLYSSAPGLVQSLSVSSVNVTNITIRWDRVDCQERNGRIDSYRLVYYPTLSSNPSDQVAQTLVGTGDNDRMFSITGLPPRTSYTFEVQASNTHIDACGPRAFYTANTTAPQGKHIN